MVFYDAEVAMILAVFLAMNAAQEHVHCRLPEVWCRREATWSVGTHPRGSPKSRLQKENKDEIFIGPCFMYALDPAGQGGRLSTELGVFTWPRRIQPYSVVQ